MENEQRITQREWEDYVQAKDDLTKMLSIPNSDMTDEIWAKWRYYHHIVDEVHSKYWYHADELLQRYEDSLVRVD